MEFVESQEELKRRGSRQSGSGSGSGSGAASGAEPPTPSGLGVRPRQGFGADHQSLEAMREAIRKHLNDSDLELIVIVEAIDPFSSNTFQGALRCASNPGL